MNITRQFLFVCGTLFSLISHATDYYVATTGDNSDGLSLETAFLTVQQAADLVVAGDTVYVADGVYAGFDVRNTNGTSTQPISFIALGSNVILNQPGPIRDDIINIEGVDYVIIDGFTARDSPFAGNGIRVVLSNHCIIRNNFCDNNGQRGIFTGFTDDILIENNVCINSNDEHGIYVSNSSDRPIIRFNECYGNNSIGIHMNGDLSAGGDGIISDPQIYGNKLHDNNQAAGINLDGVERPVIYNNLIYNNHFSQGIAMFQQDGAIVSYGGTIYNNTIVVPDDGRWGILLMNGASVDTKIYNNIIITEHAWRGCIAAEGVTGLSSDYNIVNDRMSGDDGDNSVETLSDWQDLGLDLNSQLADAQDLIFMDPINGDYHLLPSSQAVNTGTDLVSPIVVVDLDGNTRPIGAGYDIGAYEYDSLLSISSQEESIFSIYPNPVSNVLHIQNKTGYVLGKVSLLTLDGKQMEVDATNGSIDLSQVTQGIYILEMCTESSSKCEYKRVVIQQQRI